MKHELIKWSFWRWNYLIELTYMWPDMSAMLNTQWDQRVILNFVLCGRDPL